ncbi:MAG: S-layer homology domain-containing protein, partial [Eubacteriales bacterium]
MKKFLKPVISLTLAASLSLGSLPPALAYEPEDARVKADVLNALELFQGTENGYELDKPLTRMEALIMLIRLSGKELDALYLGDYSHPFTDATDWEDAGKYLGYAYENGLTAGVSATEFAPEARADLQMYITFVLRALGYKDT